MTLEDWIEKWGTNLDWEAKAALKDVVNMEKVAFLEKEIAELKVQVSVRPKVQTNEQIINDQLVFLESTQEQFRQRGAYDSIAPIAREITELITLKLNLMARL